MEALGSYTKQITIAVWMQNVSHNFLGMGPRLVALFKTVVEPLEFITSLEDVDLLLMGADAL